jgi:hypothetical protein
MYIKEITTLLLHLLSRINEREAILIKKSITASYTYGMFGWEIGRWRERRVEESKILIECTKF